MNVRVRETNRYYSSEGFIKSVIISAVSKYKVNNEIILTSDYKDGDQIQAAIIDLEIRQLESPFTVRKSIWGFPETDSKKGTEWMITRLFQAAGCQGIRGDDESVVYKVDQLIGKYIYPLFYKAENGYLTFFDVVPRNMSDYEYVEQQFRRSVEYGRYVKLHQNSIFSKEETVSPIDVMNNKEVEETFRTVAMNVVSSLEKNTPFDD